MSENNQLVSSVLDSLKEPKYMLISYEAHGPNNIRSAIKDFPQVSYLIKIGDPVIKPIIEKFKIEETNEMVLCCIAYILEKLKSQTAIVPLLEYLKKHRLEMPRDWPAHFVTHTLKILTGQKDVDGIYFSYNTEERERTIQETQNRLNRKVYP